MIQKNRQYLYSIANDLKKTLLEHDAQSVFVKNGEGYSIDISQIEITE